MHASGQVHHVALELPQKPPLGADSFEEARQSRPLSVENDHRRVGVLVDEPHLAGGGPEGKAALRIPEVVEDLFPV